MWIEQLKGRCWHMVRLRPCCPGWRRKGNVVSEEIRGENCLYITGITCQWKRDYNLEKSNIGKEVLIRKWQLIAENKAEMGDGCYNGDAW